MLEQRLIDHCSPTLASLKTASLFNLPCACNRALSVEVLEANKKLNGKGISITILKRKEQNALIYVYRRKQLADDLHRSCVMAFLEGEGYRYRTVEEALACLRGRIAGSDEFPHEIGLFLGYPLEDVQGFIHHKGKNYKCVGCWKVYGDAHASLKQFERFNKCRHVYKRLWRQGKSIAQLTVTV